MSTSVTAGYAGTSSGSAAILVGRILLSIMYIMAGYSKLTAIGATAGWFASIGLPAPTATVVVVGLVEVVAGLAVLVGFQTRVAALVLAAFTIGATLIAHMNFADMNQFLFFQKNFAIVGGFLVLAAAGAGAYSIDARRG